ncbi:MAG: MdtA/MuxA family multidrug efflux RND transporter periplasmic adaptor subunit [Rhizomicrobium sp.]|nr:MdtA/MuxA family multidrug efflux RND transporter periplasmic adaptor subunit [Rhizomicrobium sp.]
MSKQDDTVDTATGWARRNIAEARSRLGGAQGEGDGWVSRHVPGGPKTLWILLAIVLVVLFVWWLLPGKAKTSQRGMGGPQPVGVALVQRGPLDVTLNALGTVTPLATVSVRPQVSGQIIRFSFKEGQMVKAGDVLAEIDPRTFEAAVTQAQGQLARDNAQLADARIQLARQRALMAANATSRQTLDTQAATVKQLEGTVLSDSANVKSAQVNLGYTHVTSPVAGRAGIRTVDVGNFVSAGQTTAIVVVTQLEPISVLFTVPEDSVHAVLERYNTGDDMQVEAYDRGQTVKLATGRLTAIDTQVDTTTGTVKMRAMFANDDGELFPNQFVNVRLLVNTLQNQVIVPSAAVQRGASGTFVFVVKADHTVAMRVIKLGPQQGDHQAVISGLNPGETVVTDGADRLRDGSEVTVPSGQKVTDVKGSETVGSGLSDKEKAERRAKMIAACGADIKKYCADAKGRELMMCMRENRDSLSETCQAELKKMRRSGGGAGGPPRGGPGGP